MEKELIKSVIQDTLKKYSYKASDECIEAIATNILAVTYVSAHDTFEYDSWDSWDEYA